MEELIKQTENAKTKIEKQVLAAKIVSAIPQFLKEYGELEQEYHKLLKQCVELEGSRARGELLIREHDIHRQYMLKKRLYSTIETTLTVLNMYVVDK